MDIQATTLSKTPRQPSLSIGRVVLTVVIASLMLSTTGCSSPHPAAGATPVAAAPASAMADQSSACLTSQLQFSLDGGDGRFNGMSHSGTMLVLRNLGPLACSIAAKPVIAFTDTNSRSLDIAASKSGDLRATSAPPITLAPGGTAISEMRWISGDVFDHGHCETPTRITLAVGKQTVGASFDGHLCGELGKPARYTSTSLKLAEMPTSTVAAKQVVYVCDDGRNVQATYPDHDTVILAMGGQIHRLHTAVSADGARYVGGQWQWWAKGVHQAQLAPLQVGETIASARGTTCTAP